MKNLKNFRVCLTSKICLSFAVEERVLNYLTINLLDRLYYSLG